MRSAKTSTAHSFVVAESVDRVYERVECFRQIDNIRGDYNVERRLEIGDLRAPAQQAATA